MANKITSLINNFLPKCFFKHSWEYTWEMVEYSSLNGAQKMSFNTHIRYCSKCHKKQAERMGLSGNDNIDWFDYNVLNKQQQRDKKIDEII